MVIIARVNNRIYSKVGIRTKRVEAWPWLKLNRRTGLGIAISQYLAAPFSIAIPIENPMPNSKFSAGIVHVGKLFLL